MVYSDPGLTSPVDFYDLIADQLGNVYSFSGGVIGFPTGELCF